ncbi:MAG: hypothetical protein MUC43_12515 [Pirellula sp.]|jgi:hypothetical protein|nr:hypothetical protein [Pirellula sp.]
MPNYKVNIVLKFTLCFALFVGCFGQPKSAPPVDKSKALELLRTTLDRWKDGEDISRLADPPIDIVAQDFDWMGKKELTEYRVIGEGESQDANLRVEVELTLKGSSKPKRVYYIVGTSPAQTVFRAFE